MRTERPTLQVIEGGHGQPVISQAIDLVRLAEELRETGAILAAELRQLRERLDQVEQQAELALLAERIARREADQLRARLDGRQWSLSRRFLWVTRGY